METREVVKLGALSANHFRFKSCRAISFIITVGVELLMFPSVVERDAILMKRVKFALSTMFLFVCLSSRIAILKICINYLAARRYKSSSPWSWNKSIKCKTSRADQDHRRSTRKFKPKWSHRNWYLAERRTPSNICQHYKSNSAWHNALGRRHVYLQISSGSSLECQKRAQAKEAQIVSFTSALRIIVGVLSVNMFPTKKYFVCGYKVL